MVKSLLCRLPGAALAAVAIVAAVEFTQVPFGDHSPVGKRLIKAFHDFKSRGGQLSDSPSVKSSATDAGVNPFLDMGGDEQQKLMPFLNFSYATGVWDTGRDYFGFRNHLGNSVYTLASTRPLIIVTGNSEAVGVTHPKSIAQLLQEKLENRGLRYDVLDLAMNAYTMAMEIEAYVSIGDKLCPSLVIAHTTAGEYVYGQRAERYFRKFGLPYRPEMKNWAYRMYNLKDGQTFVDEAYYLRDPATVEEIAEFTIMNSLQYASIVERGGNARFLLGIQKSAIPGHENFEAAFRPRIQNTGINHIDFSNETRVVMADSIHTTAQSADVIADEYANWIEAHATSLASKRDKSHCIFNYPELKGR